MSSESGVQKKKPAVKYIPHTAGNAQSLDLDAAVAAVVDVKVDADGLGVFSLVLVCGQVGHRGLDLAQVQLDHLKQVGEATAAVILTRLLQLALNGRFHPAFDRVLDKLRETARNNNVTDWI